MQHGKIATHEANTDRQYADRRKVTLFYTDRL